jgi:hypothetical protein
VGFNPNGDRRRKQRFKVTYLAVQLVGMFLHSNYKSSVYRISILPVVLYACETWSLRLREEHRLRVLRRIFGPKTDEVTGDWRKLHNEELHNLYSSPSIIRVIKSRIKWAGHLERMGKKRNAYRTLMGKPEGKTPLGRPRRRWVDNFEMDLRQIGWDGVHWTDMAQDRDQWRALVP